MRRRWSIILPVIGLLLFAIQTERSFAHGIKSPRYFWWSGIRLDKDPLNRHQPATQPCKEDDPIQVCWDPVSIWIDPGPLTKLLFLIALPAFLAEEGVLYVPKHFGASEVWVFLVTLPLLITAWLYLVGWLLDRWGHRRRLKRAA